MSDVDDVSLLLKKKARRRLVGALALTTLAAVVLPMVMDDEPKQRVDSVQVTIPGQDSVSPLNPKPPRAQTKAEKEPEKELGKTGAPANKEAEKATEKPTEKPAEKVSDKPAKPAEVANNKPTPANSADPAAILAGGSGTKETSSAADKNTGQSYAVLIGAFANQGNVKVLQSKLDELNIKMYTEPASGGKTRVRAGPFPSKDAAEKALGRMKKIGIDGVVAVKR